MERGAAGDRLPARPPRRGGARHRARDGRRRGRRRSSRRRRCCATGSPPCGTCTSARSARIDERRCVRRDRPLAGRAGRQRAGVPRARRGASSTGSPSTSRTPPAARPHEVLEEFLLEFYWERRGHPAGDRRAARGGARTWRRCWRRGAAPRSRCARAQARPQAPPARAGAAQRRAGRRRPRPTACAPQRGAHRGARAPARRAWALAELPLRIECYDISNLGERHPVGSMVVFEGGLPKKAHYRKFSVRDGGRPGRLRHDERGAAAALRAPRRRADAGELRRELRHAARPGRGRRRQGPALGRRSRRCARAGVDVDRRQPRQAA